MTAEQREILARLMRPSHSGVRVITVSQPPRWKAAKES